MNAFTSPQAKKAYHSPGWGALFGHQTGRPQLSPSAHSSNEIREGVRVASGHRANRREAYNRGGSFFSACPRVAKMDIGQTNVRP